MKRLRPRVPVAAPGFILASGDSFDLHMDAARALKRCCDIPVVHQMAPLRAFCADVVSIFFPWVDPSHAATLLSRRSKVPLFVPPQWMGDTPVEEERRMVADAVRSHFRSESGDVCGLVTRVCGMFRVTFNHDSNELDAQVQDEDGAWEPASAHTVFVHVRRAVATAMPTTYMIAEMGQRMMEMAKRHGTDRPVAVTVESLHVAESVRDVLGCAGWRPVVVSVGGEASTPPPPSSSSSLADICISRRPGIPLSILVVEMLSPLIPHT